MQPPDIFTRFRARLAEPQPRAALSRWRCRAMGWTFYFDEDEAPNVVQRLLMRLLIGAQFTRR
jgi:hypothetical protein